MEVSVTRFRRDLFDLIQRAGQGESISITYKGDRFRLVPEIDPKTRFDRLTPLEIVNPAYPDLATAKQAMREELEELWEKKWADL